MGDRFRSTAGGWLAASNRSQHLITGVMVVTLDTTRADGPSPYGFTDVRIEDRCREVSDLDRDPFEQPTSSANTRE